MVLKTNYCPANCVARLTLIVISMAVILCPQHGEVERSTKRAVGRLGLYYASTGDLMGLEIRLAVGNFEFDLGEESPIP